MRTYRNVFKEIGISELEIEKRLMDTYQKLFYGKSEERIYHEMGEDMGYIEDTGNHDVRSEGMSYGMMMCVQMDKKEEFNRLWKWAKTYMWMGEGENSGFFAWSCGVDGAKNAYGPAPDGEEFFAMALHFAAKRWGEGKGIFHYTKEANSILKECIHKGENGLGKPMWEPYNKLIKFITECDFTNPSYHLPHFYELFAKWANEEDREFWKEAAKASREYLKVACHPITGLSAEYAEYDGSPCIKWNEGITRHDWFYSDSYRTIANIALDYEWFGVEAEERKIANNIQKFCYETLAGVMDGIYNIDGTVVEGKALHPIAIIATMAQASLAADGPYAMRAVQDLWDTPLREGDRRYYDNCLYFFALLALSGRYRIWGE